MPAVNVAQALIEAEGGPDILKGAVDVLIAEAFAMAILGAGFPFGLRYTGTVAESFYGEGARPQQGAAQRGRIEEFPLERLGGCALVDK